MQTNRRKESKEVHQTMLERQAGPSNYKKEYANNERYNRTK